MFSLGNLGDFERSICAEKTMTTLVGTVNMKCEEGFYMTRLDRLGLAYKDEVCNVKGTVNTIDRCSVSTIDVPQEFGWKCQDKNSCEFVIDFNKEWRATPNICANELNKRLRGNVFYGPPKVFGLIKCEENAIKGL